MLLLNQFFHPSSAATSQLLTDVARQLADWDHHVTAIAGRNDYAGKNGHHLGTINIRRVPNLPFAHGKLGRVASYASFFAGATLRALTSRHADTVLTLTTPPLLSLIGTALKKTRGARHIIWEMDVYPDIAVQLGVFTPRGLASRITGALADWSRRNADAIIALGEDMKDLLIARGIPAHKITVCENWADSSEIAPLPLPNGPLHVLYSGNLGLAHDIETCKSALQACPSIDFTFAGAGPRRAPLESFVRNRNLQNVRFNGYCERNDLGSHLAQGHIGLVTQDPRVLGSIVPSKVYGIMAAARPILFIGPSQATPARIIQRHNCGWQIDPGDDRGLIALLETLNQNRDLIQQAGHRARQAFLQNYDKPIALRKLVEVIEGRQRETIRAKAAAAAKS